MTIRIRSIRAALFLLCVLGICAGPAATPARAAAQGQSKPAGPPAVQAGDQREAALPPGYVIGPEDKLSVLFWQDKDMSVDVVVRPDGKITLPLLNDIQASGLTPEDLRKAVIAAAKRLVQDPNATVIVREINSRKVFITGAVEKPGHYPLNGPTTVLQLIATAAGVKEYAESSNIVIIRTENGKQLTLKFDYKAVTRQGNIAQNIELKPGDTVVVP